ncbi:MAG TPA: hypothetical protein EYP22_10980, partial [Methanosarcinales archaeon]|nr:hypothetical protein [Methanosarcinales archaeon]
MKKGTNYKELTIKFRKFFELPYSPVAVKLHTELIEKNIDHPMRYCEMVRRSAVYGESFTFSVEELSCTSAELALGFTEPRYGEVYPRIKNATTKSISLMPLEKCTFEPDVVIVIANPRKIMRIATIISQIHNREPVEVKFKGEFAVCGECTAIPYMESKVNLSLLCSGARMFSEYKNDEIVIGFPFEEFVAIAESTEQKEITSALCGCIMDDLPNHVIMA